MTQFSTKIAGIALAAVFFVGVAMPAEASSLTQTQISAVVSLLQSFGVESAIIAQVQTVLGGTSQEPSSCVDLSHNLTLGSAGNDVTSLQNYLADKGYLTASTRGYYGFLTAQAVGKLQLSRGIVSSASDTAYGIMGPRTRAAIRCGGTVYPQQTAFSVTPTYGIAPLAVVGTIIIPPRPAGIIEPCGPIVVAALDWGDSSPTEFPKRLGCSNQTAVTASHTYTSAGTYTAVLSSYAACMYSNPRCMMASTLLGSATITVGASSNSGTLSALPSSGAPPLSVHFTTNNMTMSPSTIKDWYTVDFGDGTSGNLTLGTCSGSVGCADHTYTQSGTYTARIVHHPDPAANCPTTNGTYCGSTLNFNTATVTVWHSSLDY